MTGAERLDDSAMARYDEHINDYQHVIDEIENVLYDTRRITPPIISTDATDDRSNVTTDEGVFHADDLRCTAAVMRWRIAS